MAKPPHALVLDPASLARFYHCCFCAWILVDEDRWSMKDELSSLFVAAISTTNTRKYYRVKDTSPKFKQHSSWFQDRGSYKASERLSLSALQVQPSDLSLEASQLKGLVHCSPLLSRSIGRSVQSAAVITACVHKPRHQSQ